MSAIAYPIRGFAHLYRSLLRFTKLDPPEANMLTYLLNTANLDTVRYSQPGRLVREMNEAAFFRSLDGIHVRPYHTEVQLYRSIEDLSASIYWHAITDEQRNAVIRVDTIRKTLARRFHDAFGIHIDDSGTVYALCCDGLVPDADEPRTCLRESGLNHAS